MKGLQIRVTKSFHRYPLNVFLEEDSDGYYSVAKPVIMERVEVPYEPITPTCNISITAAQQLIDDLWACGIRPSEGTGSAGQLAAVQKHLDDMRKLVSKVPLVGK